MMKCNLLKTTLAVIILLQMIACKDSGTQPQPAGESIILENQTDHSGIMIRLVESNKFVITDSLGRFEFDSLAQGHYTLEAKYPYFKKEQRTVLVEGGKIQTSINIVLKQQLQFWIEPAETTISMNNVGHPDVFSINKFRQYLVNITDKPIKVGTYVDPIDLWAFVPQDIAWPYIPNPDSLPEYCNDSYGRFIGTDAIIDVKITLQPWDTLFVQVPQTTHAEKKCFQEGTYLFFSAISDLGHYPEYFDPAFVKGYMGGDKKILYDRMNLSSLKKIELFRPAIVHITN